jgi:hypothetical protein
MWDFYVFFLYDPFSVFEEGNDLELLLLLLMVTPCRDDGNFLESDM